MSLIVRDLSKKYGEKTVVDHISFQMNGPGVYALLGTNGAGKTTTIRMMLDMLEKDSGEVLWNDKPLSFTTCNIGYLAEERGLYPKYPIIDQLRYFAKLRGVSDEVTEQRIRYWAERLNVEEYIFPGKAATAEGTANAEGAAPASNQAFGFHTGGSAVRVISTPRTAKTPVKKEKPRTPDQLSKGNQQKIQFMIAMISDPELLILDEPFSGLDPVNSDILRSVIHEQIDAGKTIIMSSHQMPAVEEFCTDITILHRSRAVVSGNLNEIKKSYGRINLSLKTEEDISAYARQAGVTILNEKEHEYDIRVTGQDQALDLLKLLVDNRICVVRFDLREPSLHEIFVKEVGADNEDQV
ncbi:MAG: ATP-binding cassette domain-containing protein [Lachnospiraceae bacterium]|nr:ATP-binding cassette domain-containing protein [Lachnospiraceae bacterium]